MLKQRSDLSSDNSRRPVWRAGTLTYTFGALMMLCFWLLWGDFTWSMKDRAVGPSATLLIKSIGVSEFVYGLIVISFPNFTNIFLTPIISYMSDRHRGRWGRRIPFLMFTTPFIVLGLYGLGFTRVGGAMLHRVFPELSLHGAMLLIFCISWVLLDFGTTLASSLFNALVNDVVPPELLGRFFGLFRAVSLGAGMLFNLYLIHKVESYGMWVFLGIGTLYGTGLLMLCLKVKEGQYPPPPEAEQGPDNSRLGLVTKVFHSSVTYLRQSFSLSYYRWYILTVATVGLCFLPINSYSIQYSKHLGIATETYGKYLFITYLCSLILSYFLGMLADRFHPLRTGIAALSIYAVLMATGWFLLADPEWFELIFILHGVISGCYFTLSASLGARLLPRALFAQFSSAGAIIQAIFTMLAAPAMGRLIDFLNYNYRCVFPVALVATLLSLTLFCKLYRNYLRHGGDRAYQPPMPE